MKYERTKERDCAWIAHAHSRCGSCKGHESCKSTPADWSSATAPRAGFFDLFQRTVLALRMFCGHHVVGDTVPTAFNMIDHCGKSRFLITRLERANDFAVFLQELLEAYRLVVVEIERIFCPQHAHELKGLRTIRNFIKSKMKAHVGR